MMPQVDLYEVLKLCAALLMLAVTVGLCAFVAGMVVMMFRGGKGGE